MTRYATLVVITLIITVPWIADCNSNNASEIVLVFPDGFRGVAIIRASRPDGVPIESKNGVITLTFPRSGILDIKEAIPTFDWHRLSAKFANGEDIPIYDNDDQEVPVEKIALRSAGVVGKTEDWYVVGTYDDLKKVLEKKYGIPKAN